jgi:putative ABC transport system permease protein
MAGHAQQYHHRFGESIMMFTQLRTAARISLLSLPQRVWLSLVTLLSVALVVSVLLGFLAMANGFRITVKSTGSESIAIAQRSGSQGEITSNVSLEQVRLLADAPGVARDAAGNANISPEIYVVVDGIKRSSNTPANLPLRGISTTGVALREGIRITEGRMFTPGSNEMVVGRSILTSFKGFELGSTIRLGTDDWTVVGIFDAGGSVFESELWADLNVVQSLFNRQAAVQIVRLGLAGNPAESLAALKRYSEGEPRLQLDVLSEKQYFAEQSSATADLIFYLGWPLGIAMALGALAGAMNAMYSSVSNRTREIVTLRIIGFSGSSAFMGTLSESVVLALLGGVLGSALCFVFFDGMAATTLGSSFTQIVFKFELTPDVIAQGMLMALVIGIAGGVLPARKAARMPLTVVTES